MENEVWKPVVGYEGLYEVSNQGRVRSINRVTKGRWGTQTFRGTILRASNRTKSSKNSLFCYQGVNLHRDGIGKNVDIHRLVAEAFIPNPNNLPIVNHIDENPSNNNVENLEWCTQKHNQNHGTLPERRKLINIRAVNQYTLEGDFVRRYNSLDEARKEMKLPPTSISNACRGYSGSAGGFLWRYTNPTPEEKELTRKRFDSLYRQMVVQLTLDREFVALYKSSKSASRAIKRSDSRICEAINNNNRTAAGYKWMRYSDYKESFPERIKSTVLTF